MDIFRPYILLYSFFILSFIVIQFYLHRYVRATGPGGISPRQKIENRVFWLYALLVFLFIGTRDALVGTDTISYVYFFRSPNFHYQGAATDPAFEFIGRFLRDLSTDDKFFIFADSLISCYGLFYLITKTSLNKLYALLLFLMAGTASITLFLYMSMMRQCTAMSFYFVSSYLFFSNTARKKRKYILAGALYMVAVLTHKSVLFSLPFILVAYFKPFKKSFWLIVLASSYVLSALNITFVNQILDIASNAVNFGHYENYRSLSFGFIEGKGWLNMNLLPFMAIAFMLLYLETNDKLKLWYNQLFLWGVLANNLFYNNLMWSRLILYLTILVIIVIPNALHGQKLKVQIGFSVPIFAYFMYKVTTQLLVQTAFSAEGLIVVPYHSWLFDGILY
ncbi:hypothetical protein Prede_2115 [Prevotella dentalis DSM 3688]|uniref:Brp/Blh family beta-carotene 15,15'-monooxygenase n=1 Tax=Prevotella dentalis (strain ATCC 49559 / DSM 3688 / JCM 13448 / NCTC 12043 / ES 2772) TaxID=908937 RepID=F9D624_PREDD|nr:EpsG family protein [Prevotella dentalis]AGB29388.1 hypothetical protein Prede_2115 [Prevotella dentalis DSM 3688]EGQ12419.1 brp/Blh family beta-carotene 15,15'-monooxygenase [Prevotella dentalis DSM 3688]